MAIGRLIAEALLKGESVDIPGLGVFQREVDPSTVHEHGDRQIWTAPQARVILTNASPESPVIPGSQGGGQ